jgi:[ribosomal protein S5]-alanine N-acetyltransferase
MWRSRPALARLAYMEVDVSPPSAADSAEFIAAVRASRSLHHPWLDLPDTYAHFAGYLSRAARDDQAGYLIRHRACGGLVGMANINAIVRGGFQSGYLGYGAFASHAGRGLMTAGLRAVLSMAFSELGLHRVEANIQPGNARSLAMAHRLGFEKEGFSRRYLHIGGDWRDHERWALLAEDWTGWPAPADIREPGAGSRGRGTGDGGRGTGGRGSRGP